MLGIKTLVIDVVNDLYGSDCVSEELICKIADNISYTLEKGHYRTRFNCINRYHRGDGNVPS